MTTYHYQNSPVIDHVEIRLPSYGLMHASIVAKPDASSKQLEQLRQQLAGSGFSVFMDVAKGQPSLEIRGCPSDKALFKALSNVGHSHIGARKEVSTKTVQKPPTLLDRLRNKALFLSAIFYDLGNSAFFVSSFQRARHNPDGKATSNDISEAMIGGAFFVGDGLMTIYGSDKGNEELNVAAAGLTKHLKQQGVQLTEQAPPRRGFLATAHSWMHRNIIPMKCLTEIVGGLFTIHAALKPQFNHTTQKMETNPYKVAAGVLLATGWATTLVLNKPRGHGILDDDKHPPTTLKEKILDNPRGWVTRPLSMANNISNLYGSLNPKNGERIRMRNDVEKTRQTMVDAPSPENTKLHTKAKDRAGDYVWNVVSAVSFLIAHMLFGLSGSKKQKDPVQDMRMTQDLVLLSANQLALQPEHMQGNAIRESANYIAKLSRVSMDRGTLEKNIHEKVQSIRGSAWAARAQSASAKPEEVSIAM